IERIVGGTAQAAGVSARMEYRRINRATVNDRAMAELVIETAQRLLGPENVDTDTRTLGAEAMAGFLPRVPGVFFFWGCGPASRPSPDWASTGGRSGSGSASSKRSRSRRRGDCS